MCLFIDCDCVNVLDITHHAHMLLKISVHQKQKHVLNAEKHVDGIVSDILYTGI